MGGDREAYEELVLRHQRRAFNIAYRMLGDYDEALDATQEAFLQAYRSLSRFREEARFSHWFATIIVNHCRNRLKLWKRRARSRTRSLHNPAGSEDREFQTEIPDPSPSSLETLESRQIETVIMEEMKHLEEEYRTVLILREVHEMAYDEIADILGIAAGTVKSRLHRGRTELRGRLRRRLEMEPRAEDGEGKMSTSAEQRSRDR